VVNKLRKKVVAMVLVGGRGSRLENITKLTAKPAVSFGGKYRLIDFVLSNLSNSGINTIGLITQYEPHDLLRYVEHGSTWDLDVNDAGISFLTPYTSLNGELWQKGTAHAIVQHCRFVDQYDPDYVLILSGDQVYKMDYNLLIKEHISKKADITISTFKVEKDKARFGILKTDDNKRIIDFEEKPKKTSSNLASMGIYVFNRGILRSLLNGSENNNFDFGKDIIPLSIKKKLNVFAYEFDGYFRDVGTVNSLYEANMDLLDNPNYLKINDYRNLPILTKSENLPPHHVGGSGEVKNAMISDGCLIYGEVDHSIISSGVLLKKGSIIKDSIIHKDVKIGENCVVEKAIIMENSVVLANSVLKFDKVTVVDNEFLWKLGDIDE